MNVTNDEYNQIVAYLNLFLQIKEQKMVLAQLQNQLNDKATEVCAMLPMGDPCFINEEGLGQFVLCLKHDAWATFNSSEDIKITELKSIKCLDT